MQTFLPSDSFIASAMILDSKRLGKQRVEVLQLLNALQPESRSHWRNHPAAKMWRGFENALTLYGMRVCEEWQARGFKDTILNQLQAKFNPDDVSRPPWLGNEEFHRSHRSNLIRKWPEYYSRLWPDVPDNLPYVWPVK